MGLIRGVIVAIGALTVAAGCQAPADRSLADRYPDGLRLGYAAEAPYAFVDGAGRVTGAIPELARLVTERLGLPVTFVQSDFGALLDQLDEGRYDVVASGLFITAERERRVRFSTPTFQAVDSALVRRGNPLQFHSLDDVRTAGAAVVVLAASVEEALARRAGIAADRTIAVPDAAAARRALESGQADLLLNSEPAVHWMAARDPAGALAIAEPFVADATREAPRLGAFAFRRDDHDLVDAWNGALADIIGTPEHLALIEPFGFSERSLPHTTSPPTARTAQ